MNGAIEIRFYEELNDFLSPERRKIRFMFPLEQNRSVKDLIEAIGVPHTEVDLILVNGLSVDFSYLVRDGDDISVYPVFESLDISPLTHLRPKPLRNTRFVLDTHLGRLAAYLRMLGFDSLYRNDYDDPTLARISYDEKRILLTCDRQLLMRKEISHGYFVRSRQPGQQLLEVISRLDLFDSLLPFTRCIHCNGKINAVDKQSIESRLLPETKKYYDAFWQCDRCKKIYWQGSHYQRMRARIAELRRNRSASAFG